MVSSGKPAALYFFDISFDNIVPAVLSTFLILNAAVTFCKLSNAGFVTMISYFKAFSLRLATGIILLANKKATPLIKMATTSKGIIKRNKGMPADLMATNSKLSPRFPNVIIDESSNESGNARGTAVAAT